MSAASPTDLSYVDPDPQCERQFVVTKLYPGSVCWPRGHAIKKETYHRGFLARRIVYRSEGGVEVVEVHFTLRLKFVEEVEETKCEGGPRANPSCRKPAGTKELATAGSRFYPRVITRAVCDLKRMNAGGVEQCKL